MLACEEKCVGMPASCKAPTPVVPVGPVVPPITATQLACIGGCKVAGATAAALNPADLVKYTADGVKET